jgi:hypothetical protein
MEQPQLPAGQIGLTAVGIQQHPTGAIPSQHQGHGIHREIAPGQIVV